VFASADSGSQPALAARVRSSVSWIRSEEPDCELTWKSLTVESDRRGQANRLARLTQPRPSDIVHQLSPQKRGMQLHSIRRYYHTAATAHAPPGHADRASHADPFGEQLSRTARASRQIGQWSEPRQRSRQPCLCYRTVDSRSRAADGHVSHGCHSLLLQPNFRRPLITQRHPTSSPPGRNPHTGECLTCYLSNNVA
jgi:hypothetical protein